MEEWSIEEWSIAPVLETGALDYKLLIYQDFFHNFRSSWNQGTDCGSVGEWFNPAVLKTAGQKWPVSSNLTASANQQKTACPSHSITLNTPQTTCACKLNVNRQLTYLDGLSSTGNTSIHGDYLSRNGKNIGSTYTYSGVSSGGNSTGTPD